MLVNVVKLLPSILHKGQIFVVVCVNVNVNVCFVLSCILLISLANKFLIQTDYQAVNMDLNLRNNPYLYSSAISNINM